MPPIALSPRMAVDTVAPSTRATLTISADGFETRFALDATPPRLRVGLVLPARSDPVDVSAQPTVVASALGSPSPNAERDAEQLAAWVAGYCEQHLVWASPERDLARALTGAAFPLLAHLYGRGACTVTEVPRWATGPLAQATPRAASSVLFGRAVSRAVVAALARSLLPLSPAGSPPALLPLSLALMGRSVLPPDALVRVLHSADDRSHDPAELPTVDDIGRVRLLASWMGPRRIERMLTDAGSIADGPRLLVRTAVLLEGIPAGACLRLPIGLTALHERCRELTPIDPRPRQPVPGPPTTARATATAGHQRVVRVPRHALVAPARPGGTIRVAGALDYPPTVGRLHGRVLAPRLRLVLPRSIAELTAWARQLHNCLDTFGGAVASGRSLVIGVERDDVLTYCAELTPASRTMRQLHGPYNHAVPAAVATVLCRVLLSEGLVDSRHPVNLPWVDLCRATAIA
ncbi:MAG: hypothetical protein ACT452_19625 [Microthrixaceae bacterium]